MDHLSVIVHSVPHKGFRYNNRVPSVQSSGGVEFVIFKTDFLFLSEWVGKEGFTSNEEVSITEAISEETNCDCTS